MCSVKVALLEALCDLKASFSFCLFCIFNASTAEVLYSVTDYVHYLELLYIPAK